MRRWMVALFWMGVLMGSLWAQTPPIAATNASFDGVMRPTPSGSVEAYLPAIERSSHAANLLELKNGDLLCSWFSGSGEGGSGVAIVLSRLRRGTRQWTTPVVVDRQPGFSFQNPVIFEAPSGELWIIHTAQPAGEGQQHARVLVTRSHDGGKSWSAPTVLFDTPGAFVRDPLLVRGDGAWLLPMYFTPSGGIVDGADENYSVVRLSRDAGKSWSNCAIPASGGYVQPSVVRQGDHYVAFFRSRFADYIFRATSKDGCAWTEPKPTVLPNNNASIQAFALQDGRIAMVFNDTHAPQVTGKPATGPRVPLNVALSSDEGKSWPQMRALETKQGNGAYVPGATAEEYSYPSIVQTRDGSMVAAYTYRRQTIKIVRFKPEWVAK